MNIDIVWIKFLLFFSTYIPVEWIPKIVELYMYVLELFNKLSKQIKKIIYAIKNSFDDDVYIFLKNSAVPIKCFTKYSTDSIENAEWMYSVDTNTFSYQPYNLSSNLKKVHVPYLSATLSVLENDVKKSYDLSDWLEEIHVNSIDTVFPSWNVLLSAWLLVNNCPLTMYKDYRIEAIDENGEDVVFHPMGEAAESDESAQESKDN